MRWFADRWTIHQNGRRTRLLWMAVLILVAGGILAAVMFLPGCTSTLDSAVFAANGARSTEVFAADILREQCTNQYRVAAKLPTASEIRERIVELDASCIPGRRAYGVLRASRLALLAALTAYKATKDEAALEAAIERAAQAATAAASAVGALEGR